MTLTVCHATFMLLLIQEAQEVQNSTFVRVFLPSLYDKGCIYCTRSYKVGLILCVPPLLLEEGFSQLWHR